MQSQKQTPPDNLRSDVKGEHAVADLEKTTPCPPTRNTTSSGGILTTPRGCPMACVWVGYKP